MASVKDLTPFGIDLNGARHISKSDFELLVKQGCQPLVGDVLISKDGNSALDTVCLVKDPVEVVLLSSVAILRPNPSRLLPQYLKQYFSCPNTLSYLKSEFISGAAIPRVILKDFKRALIKLPPLSEQCTIAHVLGTLDDKIELNRKRNQTLEAMARALFQDWFVDFGPVRAKMEGRAPYLPSHIWDLFPDRLDDEGKPEEWEYTTLSNLATVISKGTTPTRSAIEAATDSPSVRFLKVRNINDEGTIDRPSIDNIPLSIHKGNLKRSILKKGDLLFTIAGTIGRVALIDEDLNDSNCNQAIAFVRLKDVEVFQSLCWLNLRSKGAQQFVRSKIVQGVQANVSLATIGAIPILLPNNEVIKAWNELINPVLGNSKFNQSQSLDLAQLRDTLLPKLISGELCIQDADKFLEQAT